MHAPGKRHNMVNWYSPALLARMGLRAAVSTAVGQLADYRQLRAALYRQQPLFDHRRAAGKSKDFTFDYVADLGDGWQSTFAVASAITAAHQPTDDGDLASGSLLIMGGDEIYPEPSLQGYQERTIAPWNTACRANDSYRATLYALPGNHDWYDGLSAFSDVFCKGGKPYPLQANMNFRNLGTPQTHSYFALQLPHGWWLCAIDIQLNNHVDARQLEFFRSVAGKVKKGEQIVLCAPTPSWVRETTGWSGDSEQLASILSLLQSGHGHVSLILAGDLHHYSRYENRKNNLTAVTAGGGGAFMHPTHKLPQTGAIISNNSEQLCLDNVSRYPASQISRRMAWKNLAFPFMNGSFSIFLGAIYTLLSWFLVTRQINSNTPLLHLIDEIYSGRHQLMDTVWQFFNAIPKSPEFAIFVTLFTAAFVGFNITRNLPARIGFGILHTLVHIFALVSSYCIAVELIPLIIAPGNSGWLVYVLFFGILFGFGCLLGGLVFGAFLLIALNLLGWQWTNAFSSLRIADYKNFLRLKILPDGSMAIYAFGIDDVSRPSINARQIDKTVIASTKV